MSEGKLEGNLQNLENECFLNYIEDLAPKWMYLGNAFKYVPQKLVYLSKGDLSIFMDN